MTACTLQSNTVMYDIFNAVMYNIFNVNVFISFQIPLLTVKKLEVIAVSFDLTGTIVFALILIRRPVQLAHHIKTKSKKVVVLLKNLTNAAIVLVKYTRPVGKQILTDIKQISNI